MSKMPLTNALHFYCKLYKLSVFIIIIIGSANAQTIGFGDRGFSRGQVIPANHQFPLGTKFVNIYVGNLNGTTPSPDGALYYIPQEGLSQQTDGWFMEPTVFNDGGFATITWVNSINSLYFDPKALIIKTTDGSPFKFISFKAHDAQWQTWGNYLTVIGYNNGVQAVSENVILASHVAPWYSTVTLTAAGFGSVDEVRIIYNTNNPEFISNNNPDANGLYHSFDTFIFDAVLPVTFGPVNAEIINEQLRVSWNTISETNNKHFEIEISKNGEDFVTMAKVISKANKGNSSTPLQYEISIGTATAGALLGLGALSLLFSVLPIKSRKAQIALTTGLLTIASYGCYKNDNSLAGIDGGKIYLRIAQVDTDGTTSYSKIIIVNTANR